jgi:ribose transport system permease protein
MTRPTETPGNERTRRPVMALAGQLAAPGTSLVVIGLMLGICDVLAPGFVSFGNVMRLAGLAGFLGIVAIGETLVILTGGIDLSIAWVVTGAGCVFTKVTEGQSDLLAVGFVAALTVGLVGGLINGIGIAKFRISPIVMTLGMNNVLQGLTLLYTNGTPTGSTPPLIKTIATGYAGPIPVLVIFWLLLSGVVIAVLRLTRAGRRLFGVGESPLVSFLSGVRNDRVIIATYAFSGLAAALTGVLYAGFSGASFLGMGDQFVLPAIAAVVLGGTSIFGGSGGYGGTIIGALFLTVLTTMLSVVNLSAGVRDIVYGGVIIAALLLNRFSQADAR